MAAVLSALAKNKHQAVWVETVPLLFCMRCSSFPDGFARLELSALAERFDAQIRVEKTVYLCLRESCIDTFHVIPFDYTRNLLAK